MSLDQVRRRAESDFEVILEEANERAKEIVNDGRELTPFALTLSDQRELFRHDVAASSDESAATALEILAYGVRTGVTPTPPRAVALVRIVSVSDLVTGRMSSAVCVALEHVEGFAKRCFLPYSREGQTVTWQDVRCVPGVPWFFEGSARTGLAEPGADRDDR